MHWPPDEDDSKPKRAADGPRVGIQQREWEFSSKHDISVGMGIQWEWKFSSGNVNSVGMGFQWAWIFSKRSMEIQQAWDFSGHEIFSSRHGI